MAAGADAMDEALPETRPIRAWSAGRWPGTAQGHLRRPRRRGHVPHAAARSGDRDHRTHRRQALRLVRDGGCRPVPGGPGVHAEPAGGHVPGRARSPHADRPGMAARVAPQARPGAHAALPAVPHARRDAAAHARRGRTSWISRSGRPASSCRPAIGSASRCAGATTSIPAGREPGSESWATLHRRRPLPAQRRAGPTAGDLRQARHAPLRSRRPAHVLLPVVPPKE